MCLTNTFTEDELAYKRSVQKEQFNYKKPGLIAQIFEEHWEKTYANKKEVIDKYRPNAPKEIQKVIDCANNNLGSSVYICSSCGYMYKLERVENIMKKSVKCPHRQIVFTIPKELKSFF